jgi:hypothetical protein
MLSFDCFVSLDNRDNPTARKRKHVLCGWSWDAGWIKSRRPGLALRAPRLVAVLGKPKRLEIYEFDLTVILLRIASGQLPKPSRTPIPLQRFT